MPYNLTMVANQTGIVPMMQMVNQELLFGSLGIMILLTIGIMTFIAFMTSTSDPKRSFAASSFICFVSSIFFRYFNIVDDLTIYVCLVVVGISAAFLYITRT